VRLFHPRPREPGHETWKDKNNAGRPAADAFYVTGSYDPRQRHLLGAGTRREIRFIVSAGDNLYPNSALAIDAATGRSSGFHHKRPTTDGLRRSRTHTDRTQGHGEDRKILAHAARNGFNQPSTASRAVLKATQYVPTVTWTKASIPRRATGRLHRLRTCRPCDPDRKILTGAKSSGVCPGAGRQQFLVGGLSQRTKLMYIPSLKAAPNITRDQTRHVKGKFRRGDFGYDGRLSSGISMVDPATASSKQRKVMPYANTAGALATRAASS